LSGLGQRAAHRLKYRRLSKNVAIHRQRQCAALEFTARSEYNPTPNRSRWRSVDATSA
jgi:hypothetical protein